LNPTPTQDEPKAESLVPPRPNLGPEPWPEAPRWERIAGWAGLSIAFALILIGLWVRKRRRSARKLTDALKSLTLANEPEPTPRERLIATSEHVREALIRAFGPGWRSKTTEEISIGPGLIERLDPAEIDHLIAFLKLADRAKFAEGEPETVEDWALWSDRIVARLESRSESKP
jgi:Domain of unknown function (DUF4381)